MNMVIILIIYHFGRKFVSAFIFAFQLKHLGSVLYFFTFQVILLAYKKDGKNRYIRKYFSPLIYTCTNVFFNINVKRLETILLSNIDGNVSLEREIASLQTITGWPSSQ